MRSLAYVEEVCNYLNLSQSSFYGALQKLHSVINIATPSDTPDRKWYLRYPSFRNFLVDKARSGKFAAGEKAAMVDMAKTALYWQELNGRFDVMKGMMRSMDKLMGRTCHLSLSSVLVKNHAIQMLTKMSLLVSSTMITVKFLQDCLKDFIRMEASNRFEIQLLKKLSALTSDEAVEPANFPLCWAILSIPWFRQHVFVGHKEKTVIVCCTQTPLQGWHRYDKLTCDFEPSKNQISQYEVWLESKGWYREELEREDETGV
ncbi:hypothetical protein AN958_02563 [Leucoagaricus sp. SymC.cos]|nr:hypothetical protein AN958_02563 [Leucoagaricus sp. SymC.cos]